MPLLKSRESVYNRDRKDQKAASKGIVVVRSSHKEELKLGKKGYNSTHAQAQAHTQKTERSLSKKQNASLPSATSITSR
jgi:hypothetical protein